MSVVLYFYNVIWGVDWVARGHVCVPCVCSPLFLGRFSIRDNVSCDGLVCCVFAERLGFVVYVLEP